MRIDFVESVSMLAMYIFDSVYVVHLIVRRRNTVSKAWRRRKMKNPNRRLNESPERLANAE